jgi:hypothetical protein
MNVLTNVEVDRVSGGAPVRTLQEVGNYAGYAAAGSLLLGPEAIPLAISLGLVSATFLLVDSFQD